MVAGNEAPFRTLASPIRLGHVLVRNRTVITSHGASEAFRAPGSSPQPYIEYLRRRAAGGAGLIITQPPFFSPGLAHPPEILDRHAALAEAVRAEGAVLLLQLAHLGVFGRSENDVHRPPLWGFGANQSGAGETAHVMTDDEVEAMIAAFGATARLAADAGFDGVEVHGGHGYLIQQSLTPSFNSRTDRWGEDRTLFVRRILAAARDALGSGRIVGYRTTTDDLRSAEDGGIGVSDVTGQLRRILSDGVVDVLNTTIGDGGVSYARAIPDYRHGEAPNVPAVVRLREAAGVHIPVIGVGRISSVAAAEALLAAGHCDLVAMTRAHIADPELVTKALSGRGHRIRPCVGANVCVNRKLSGYPEISCLHNPQVLRERELDLTAADPPRRVLVVGGGPAGLKAAETAARRGHQVTILDAGPVPGGRLRWAERTAAAGLTAALDHVIGELAELGVKVHERIVDADALAELSPESVILATGGEPAPALAVPDAGHLEVWDSVTALSGEPGRRVLVYDTVGSNEGALVAEALSARGRAVCFVTPFETVAPHAGQLHRVQLPHTLYQRVDRVVTGGLVGAVDGRTALVVTAAGDGLAELEVDTIVAVRATQPRLALVRDVEAMRVPYRIAGDALAPRGAMQAFKEGHEAGMAV